MRILLTFLAVSLSLLASGCLSHPIDKTIDGSPLCKTAVVSVSIRELETGKIFYERDADLLLHPASTLKAFTTPVMMRYLGMDYRVATGLYKHNNNYYLKLSGDPLLTSSKLTELFKNIEIKTPIIIDDNIIDDIYWGVGWMWDDKDNPHMPKISAYNINRNLQVEKSTYNAILKPVDDPRQNFLDHLNKPVKNGKLPPEAVLVSEISHGLIEEIENINQNSDNLAAETLLKHIGGSTYSGLESFREFHKAIGADPYEQLIVDGSGVSHNNLVQTGWMSLALSKLYNTPEFEAYKNTLAQPGQKGTLQYRLTELSGRLWAKTGTLAGISGVAGYLEANSGKQYCFAILVQNYKGSSANAERLEDEILNVMAEKL